MFYKGVFIHEMLKLRISALAIPQTLFSLWSRSGWQSRKAQQ
jgi:hypothetical protein